MSKQKQEIYAECSENERFREYMNKEFEVHPGWTISRAEFEGFPIPLKAWDWSDEKMTKLANSIAEDFEPVICDDMGTDIKVRYDSGATLPERLLERFDCLCDDFYTVMETNATGMGMQYYEDFSDEEYNKDFAELSKFLYKLKKAK